MGTARLSPLGKTEMETVIGKTRSGILLFVFPNSVCREVLVLLSGISMTGHRPAPIHEGPTIPPDRDSERLVVWCYPPRGNSGSTRVPYLCTSAISLT